MAQNLIQCDLESSKENDQLFKEYMREMVFNIFKSKYFGTFSIIIKLVFHMYQIRTAVRALEYFLIYL